MGKAASMALGGAAWFAWMLEFCGWVILLGGLSGMQASCGGTQSTYVLSGGSSGYNGSVSCDVFFSYTWWILWYNFAVLIVAAVVMARGGLSRFRPGLIALLAIAIMQVCETANTFLSYNQLPGTGGTFAARYQVTVAGAIIMAIGMLLLVGILGARDESTTLFEKPPQRGGGQTGRTGGAGGPSPPLGPPVSTNVLESDEAPTARPVTTTTSPV